MKVLVFDVDGTLTRTNDVDGRFFRAAVEAVLPKAELGSFGSFSEFTDTAILRDVCAAHSVLDYETVELAVQRHFLAGLRGAAHAEPASFLPVPGACEIFSAVRKAGWTPAIATGGWRASAELKLSTAEIPTANIACATSSEAARRVNIIRLAIHRATSGLEPTEVVYVGDGTWDVRACSELSIGFVGRATAGSIDPLIEEGARATIPDFSDSGALVELLEDPSALKTGL